MAEEKNCQELNKNADDPVITESDPRQSSLQEFNRAIQSPLNIIGNNGNNISNGIRQSPFQFGFPLSFTFRQPFTQIFDHTTSRNNTENDAETEDDNGFSFLNFIIENSASEEYKSYNGVPPGWLNKRIPISNYDPSLIQSKDCCICLEDFIKDDLVRKLPCGHCFHVNQNCSIDKWFHKNNTCPKCKASVVDKETIDSKIFDTYHQFTISIDEQNEEIKQMNNLESFVVTEDNIPLFYNGKIHFI